LSENLTKNQLEQIEIHLQEEGFQNISFLPYFEVSEAFKHFYLKYLSDKKEANLIYLRNTEAKFDIRNIYPQTKSIVAASYFYLNSKTLEALKAHKYKIARYAWGRDYHNVLKKKMAKICQKFSEGRAVVDSTPLPEKYTARRANLGFIGKNGLLIHEHYGSFFLLVFYLMEKELPVDYKQNIREEEISPARDIEKYCQNCVKCVKACPTAAIDIDGCIEAEKCVSYRTIEEREELKLVKSKKHRYIFGCDICQVVCPYNKKPLFNEDDDFYPTKISMALAEGDFSGLSDDSLNGSPLKRRKIEGLKKNISMIT